jgi:hypothetical protein
MITNLALTLVNLREVAFARLAHNLRLADKDEDFKEFIDVVSVKDIK